LENPCHIQKKYVYIEASFESYRAHPKSGVGGLFQQPLELLLIGVRPLSLLKESRCEILHPLTPSPPWPWGFYNLTVVVRSDGKVVLGR
jgi:hypothetical protein